MDRLDIRILDSLQQDATLPVSAIAERVGLGTTACWRRIQKLEAEGVVRRRVVLLDGEKINAAVSVMVSIRTRSHSAQWLVEFQRAIEAIDEVVEAYRMSGDIDYWLRVVVPDIAAYDAVYKRLIQIEGLTDVSSSFAMEQLKYTTALPLGYLK
ncbi:Lrp/AsnC family transcriptional regulator [Halotalea alkalilenta]|uniref:Transcriptional regulator n=1 Tax=Halotalea alkalilenta TaxID=376489 RepID=A0A172YKJ3_9GAMM|nr:Lrp/AsnC family transcriptional regulator [Halotalea alkalilenta]ANF59739.1 transcriptional regulator [Halotalea alkalilenta]